MKIRKSVFDSYVVILEDYDSCNDMVPTHIFGPFSKREHAEQWIKEQLSRMDIPHFMHSIMGVLQPVGVTEDKG